MDDRPRGASGGVEARLGGDAADQPPVVVELPAVRPPSGDEPGSPVPGVALLTIDRRRSLNALSFEVLSQLAEGVARLAVDPRCRAVVITGAGTRAFSGGADIAELSRQTEGTLLGSPAFRGWELIGDAPIPTIAAVRGFCLGGGLELALACDMLVAGDDAVFGQPEVRLGIIPGGGGTQRLSRAIGTARATELILTGRQVKAEEAERLGFVTRVVPAAETLAAALDIAARIATFPPTAVRAALAAIRISREAPLADGLRREREAFAALFGTPGQVEGMRAFLEKREPRWPGPDEPAGPDVVPPPDAAHDARRSPAGSPPSV